MTKNSAALNPQRRKILVFAAANNLVIHPARGYDYYVEAYQRHSACPCDTTRKDCPCPQAIEECKVDGHCLCRLFWRDYLTFQYAYCGDKAQLDMKE